MYNLIVSQHFEDQSDGTVVLGRDRFLEYTDGSIATPLESLSNEAINCITSWPCILMQEGRAEERAYLGCIRRLSAVNREVRATVENLPDGPIILNGDLWKLRDELDIQSFEFNRNHWAIKARDLVEIFAETGRHVDSSVVSGFAEKPVPALSRSELLSARDAISQWTHTQIDDLLLEAGVNELVAGRELSSRRDRANAIINFVFDNPAATTADNSLFSSFVVGKANSGALAGGAESAVETGFLGGVDNELPSSRTSEKNTHGRPGNQVFVVHGRNDSARDKVVACLTDVGLDAIVLHEQPNMGRHLLRKFIDEAELVTFAVIVMTNDDTGSLKGTEQYAPRARQNVILELGYFLSHLGQERVCALKTPGLETPSDFDGIAYISMDEDGCWEDYLKRELRAAGMPLDE